MANPEQVTLLKQGVVSWNKWRRAHPGVVIDLFGADLSGANFSGAHLSGAELNRAHLSGANFSEAALSGADLRKAYLVGANLREADLRKANLTRAVLVRANLSQANLHGANLSQASLPMARLFSTCLSGANLRGADLGMVNLVNATLDGATLTDACLWETQRTGWSINGIQCEAVYWDSGKTERTIYAPGEFERLHADATRIVLRYADGIRAIEVATLPALIQCIEAIHPGCVLRLDAIQDAPGGATVTLVVDNPGEHDFGALRVDLEAQAQQLISMERRALEAEETRRQVQHTLNYLAQILLQAIQQAGGNLTISGNPTIYGPVAGHISSEVRYTYNDLAAIERFVDAYNTQRVDFSPADAATLDDHITTIDTELAAPTPNHSLLHETLETVRDILNGMSGSIAATGLLEILKGLG